MFDKLGRAITPIELAVMAKRKWNHPMINDFANTCIDIDKWLMDKGVTIQDSEIYKI